jgi:hypothetical protein
MLAHNLVSDALERFLPYGLRAVKVYRPPNRGRGPFRLPPKQTSARSGVKKGRYNLPLIVVIPVCIL